MEGKLAGMKARISNLAFIALVTLFSMFAEYWVRGTYAFQKHIYEWIILFIFYFALFKAADDLVIRFRLKDYQLFLFVAIFGMVQETFNTGGTLKDATVLGINPMGIIIPLLMWGTVQALLGFYFGKMVLGKTVEHQKMGKLPWVLIILSNAVLLIGGQFDKKSLGTPMGYTICLLIIAILLFLFIWSIRRSQSQEPVTIFKRSLFLDLIIVVYFIVLIISGTYFTGTSWIAPTGEEFGKLSTIIFGLFTIIASVALLAYRLKIKKSLPI
jgi:hypothetical protein